MSVLTAARPGAVFDTEEYEEIPEVEPALPRGFEFVDGRLEELNVSFSRFWHRDVILADC